MNKSLNKETKAKIRATQNLIDSLLMNGKRKRFYKQFIKSGDLCFDIGANEGNRIKPILELGAKIIAIEPQQECVNKIKKRFGDKVTILQVGIGAKNETKTFHISDANTLSTFSEEWIESVQSTGRFEGYSWSSERQIEIITLDSLIKTYGHPHFVKVDVEGYELEVLKGLTEPIPVISFEYAVPEFSHRAVDCLNLLLTLSSNIKCNFSIGESMHWALDRWLKGEEMIELVQSQSFTKTGAGDIYVKATL
ncbi:hypothetical protein GCM10023189_25030 [Nibrella saemangeumensis]|uniref:Methyltransferase FkbM domain-containing protein n=1 Tax=Nibrella saemangeumensis TaxID=1084526 RepID=A0ABP8MVQ3_9BACT